MLVLKEDFQRRASDSDSDIPVWSVSASEGASSPGGRPPRPRPSSVSGDGAGDGALGGGGQTGANGIGDLGGDAEYVDLDGDAGYVADSDRAAGGGPSAPVSMPKVPPPDASPRRARCASTMALIRGGTTSRGSSSDGAGAAASAGVQSEAPADRSNAEPDIEKLLLEVRTGAAVGTNAGPGAADEADEKLFHRPT